MNDFLLKLDLFLAAALLAMVAFTFWKKSKIRASVQIQSSSGDSEVMSFTYNLMEGEMDYQKKQKIQEAFSEIQRRRDFNHAEFLRIKAEAIQENEKKNPDDLKLRSVTQSPS